MKERGLKTRTVLTFVVLCPIFLVFSLLLSRWWEGRGQDFSQYWQAARMVLAGQNVYDPVLWIAEHEREGTAFHTNPPFQYPLPVAVLFIPLATLPVQSAYTLWMFLEQVMVLTSILILLHFYPARSGYFELLTIGGILFFRPMFSVINSGQIITFLLLMLAVSIWLFHDRRWFWGGFALAMLSLKPSIGLPILFLVGLWLLSRKQWHAIGGMLAGGVGLLCVGALVSYRWPIDYVNISQDVFRKYYGMHPTFWGIVDKIFTTDSVSLIIGFVCVVAVVMVEAYLFWRSKPGVNALPAFASILPAALLVAPYSWNYDQVLLIIPIVFLLINISAKYGTGKAALFILGVVALAFGMLTVAYTVGHDVWSAMNSLAVWAFSLFFAAKNDQFPVEA